MAVLGVSNNNLFSRNISVSTPNCAVNIDKENKVSNQKQGAFSLPSSAYKANFMPSFGKYRKYAEVPIFNKDTRMMDKASLMRDTIGNFVMYKMVSGSEQLGYLHMDCDAIFKENGFLSMEPDNNIPEIKYLRSIRGDKYYGIGTSLVKAAVDESKRRGKNGALWCKSEQGYAHALSPHRKNENPIPFYYKMGFKSPDFKIDALIKKGIETSNVNLLPESTVLLLSSIDVDKFKKYYSSIFTYERKTA